MTAVYFVLALISARLFRWKHDMTNVRRLRFGALAAIGSWRIAAGYFVLRPERPAPIVGIVRTTEVPIAPEIGGQLAAIGFARVSASRPETCWRNWLRPN